MKTKLRILINRIDVKITNNFFDNINNEHYSDKLNEIERRVISILSSDYSKENITLLNDVKFLKEQIKKNN